MEDIAWTSLGVYKPSISDTEEEPEKPVPITLHSPNGEEQILHVIPQSDIHFSVKRALGRKRDNIAIRQGSLRLPKGVTVEEAGVHGGESLHIMEPSEMELTGGSTEIRGHKGVLYCVLELADGRVVTCASDFTMRIWDFKRDCCERVLKGHTNEVNCMLELADGRLVSGGNDNVLRVWDLEQGNKGGCLQEVRGHISHVQCLVQLADCRVISGGNDKTLRVWDPSTWLCIQELRGHTGWVFSAVELRDGRMVSVSADKTVRVWDMHTLASDSWGITCDRCVQVVRGHARCPKFVMELVDGRILTCAADATIRIWELATGLCVQELTGHTRNVRCVVQLSGGRLVSCSNDKMLRVWDLHTGQCVQELRGHQGSVSWVTQLVDGRVLSTSHDGGLRIWEIADDE